MRGAKTMINTETKRYISKSDKRCIENYCKNQIENSDKIRVKSLACMLESQYALYEIMSYIKEELGIESKYIYHAEANYIHEMQRGHVMLCNDLYFEGVYLHQYILAQELGIKIEDIRRYTIHHIDFNKSNNDINNLWIFYDGSSHILYHQLLKRDAAANIKEFTLDYLEGILKLENKQIIERYLEILQKREIATECKSVAI